MILDATGILFEDTVNPIVAQFYNRHTGELIDVDYIVNGITTAGKNALFEAMFRSGTQYANWYFGLINGSSATLSAADTMASHAGWSEFTDYDESDRQEWDPDAASSASITNTTPAVFTIDNSGTVYGVFVASDDTKSGTTGVLWSTAAFSTPKAVDSSSLIRLTYTVNA